MAQIEAKSRDTRYGTLGRSNGRQEANSSAALDLDI